MGLGDSIECHSLGGTGDRTPPSASTLREGNVKLSRAPVGSSTVKLQCRRHISASFRSRLSPLDVYPGWCGISQPGNERDRKNGKNATFINLHKPCESISIQLACYFVSVIAMIAI